MGTRAGMLAKLMEGGEEGVRKAIALLRNEAKDAAVPLSAISKNREALERAALEADDIAVRNRTYPTGFVQDELADRDNFKLIGEPTTTDFTMVPEGTGLPALRANTLPDVTTTATRVGEEVLDTSLPALRQNTLPTALAKTGANSSSNLARNAAIGAGAAGLGLVALDGMDGGEQPPVSTAVPASILNEANRQLPKGTKVDKPAVKSDKKQIKAQDTITEAFQQAGQLPQSNEQKDDFQKQLDEARSKDADKDVLFGLLRAAQQASGALAGSKADTTFADMNLQDKNKFVNELAANQALITKRKEANDEDVLRDPNSDISKQARDIATKVGLKIGPNVTAQQLKTAGLPIGNLLTQKMAIDARKEQAALTREALAASKADKNEVKALENNIKERDKVTKLAENFTKSEDYKGYQAAKTARATLDNALVENNKAAIGSAFMMYAKIAQGDNSVVRESDMKNLAGSYNYTSPAEMISKLSAKARGAGFSPLELEQMKQVASLIEKVKAKQLQQQLSPIRTRINKFGLDANEIIDPSVLREMEMHETTEAPGLTTISKPAISQPGAPVTIRNKQTGSTKTLSTESAAKYLADPRFEKVQ